MLREWSYIVGLAAAALVFGQSAPAQKSADTLRYPIQVARSTLDTHLPPESFANLWELDPTKGQYVPALVKSWSQPNDRTYDLELRAAQISPHLFAWN